jgi:hypothetical protein
MVSDEDVRASSKNRALHIGASTGAANYL